MFFFSLFDGYLFIIYWKVLKGYDVVRSIESCGSKQGTPGMWVRVRVSVRVSVRVRVRVRVIGLGLGKNLGLGLGLGLYG